MKIYRTKTFDSAHILKLPYESKCADSIHGHTWRVEVWIEGTPNKYGMIFDFQKISNIIDTLDHKFLNEIQGLEQPTAENIVLWLIKKIKENLSDGFKLKVRVWESPNSYAEEEITVRRKFEL